MLHPELLYGPCAHFRREAAGGDRALVGAIGCEGSCMLAKQYAVEVGERQRVVRGGKPIKQRAQPAREVSDEHFISRAQNCEEREAGLER